jgi:Kef-type K+ transport system membrane component KefB
MQQLFILMVFVWTAGRLFQAAGLPLVFGEVLAGIIVGPALLNLVHPENEVIVVASELGIFFLMLHTGLKTDHRELLESSVSSVLIALGGMALTFALIMGTAWGLGAEPLTAAFVALCASISALPLMARVLKDFGIDGTRIARVSIGAAVANDIVGLIAFSVFLALAKDGAMSWAALAALLSKTVAFFTIVIALGLASAPYLRASFAKGKKAFTLTLVVALLLGSVAEWMGLHAIIGAFLAGLFMQEELIDTDTFAKIEDRFYGLAYSFFGPVFFATLAFHLDFSAVTRAPGALALIVSLAIAGKIAGSALPALLRGFSIKESTGIGLAMNCRGAVELIIASVGLEAGIIDGTVFSILVIMAFATTIVSILGFIPLAPRLRPTV